MSLCIYAASENFDTLARALYFWAFSLCMIQRRCILDASPVSSTPSRTRLIHFLNRACVVPGDTHAFLFHAFPLPFKNIHPVWAFGRCGSCTCVGSPQGGGGREVGEGGSSAPTGQLCLRARFHIFTYAYVYLLTTFEPARDVRSGEKDHRHRCVVLLLPLVLKYTPERNLISVCTQRFIPSTFT